MSDVTLEQLENIAKSHCDWFGGDGWWDRGRHKNSKFMMRQAMRYALESSGIKVEDAKNE